MGKDSRRENEKIERKKEEIFTDPEKMKNDMIEIQRESKKKKIKGARQKERK